MQTSLVAALGSRHFLIHRLLLALTLGACWTTFAFPSRAAATLLDYWDFNNTSAAFNSPYIGKFALTDNGSGEVYNATNRTISSNTANGAAFTNGVLYLSGVTTLHPNDGANTNSPPAYGAYTNSTTNGVTGDASNTTTGSSLLITNAANDSDTLLFSLSSTGYTGLTFSSAQRFSASQATFTSGGGSISWAYSTDNTVWTSLTSTGSVGYSSLFSTLSLSLPAGADNISTLYLREIINFGSTVGSFAIDNVQLTGVAAVPEPSTWALLFLGGGLLLWRLRRRAVRA